MSEDTTEGRLDTAEDPAAIGRLFETVQEGNRFTLTYRKPGGEAETTVRIEATMTPKFTSDVEDALTDGDIAFWFRDLDRIGDGDEPFGVVRYHPELARIPAKVEVHGYASGTGFGSRLRALGEVTRAVRGVDAE